MRKLQLKKNRKKKVNQQVAETSLSFEKIFLLCEEISVF